MTVSKVGFGFAAGGSEFTMESGGGSQPKHPFGGGSGGGVSITPIAFLIVSSQGVRMLHLDENTHLIEKILDAAPQAVEKIQKMMSKGNGGGNNSNSGQEDNLQPSNPGKYDGPKEDPEI
jgi:sporulation protein YtfJ